MDYNFSSLMSDQYAFGEQDKRGKLKLSAFAENADRCCHVDIMPGEGRIYFTRQGSLKHEREVLR